MSAKGKHTPGPWAWEFCGTAGGWKIRGSNGETVFIAGPPCSDISQFPDMQLMAAAPDLLAFVEKVAEGFDLPAQDARALLAKVRG